MFKIRSMITHNPALRPPLRGIVINLTSGTYNDYNLYTQAGSPTDDVDVTLNISPGVILHGSTTAKFAIETIGGFTAKSTLTINNRGAIIGKGGNGGNGGVADNTGSESQSPTVGLPGGSAINLKINTTIDNTGGYIYGGGGGGGGGHAPSASYSSGGAGGGGAGGGLVGSGFNNNGNGGDGINGVGGGGSAGSSAGSQISGSGGNYGFAGGNSGAAGGAAGKAIVKNGFACNVLVTGTIKGAIV